MLEVEPTDSGPPELAETGETYRIAAIGTVSCYRYIIIFNFIHHHRR